MQVRMRQCHNILVVLEAKSMILDESFYICKIKGGNYKMVRKKDVEFERLITVHKSSRFFTLSGCGFAHPSEREKKLFQ